MALNPYRYAVYIYIMDVCLSYFVSSGFERVVVSYLILLRHSICWFVRDVSFRKNKLFLRTFMNIKI